MSNIADPVNAQDAVSKQYITDLIGNANFYPDTTTLDQIVAPAGDVTMAGYRLTNLASATADSDALNRITADGRFYANTATLDAIA